MEWSVSRSERKETSPMSIKRKKSEMNANKDQWNWGLYLLKENWPEKHHMSTLCTE